MFVSSQTVKTKVNCFIINVSLHAGNFLQHFIRVYTVCKGKIRTLVKSVYQKNNLLFHHENFAAVMLESVSNDRKNIFIKKKKYA